MRRLIIMPIFLLLLSSQALAADDAVTKAMKLYEKRHYTEAAAMLRSEMASAGQGRQGAFLLTLGMIYLKNAELHRALYQEALVLQQDYLRKLAAARGRQRSRFVDLYLGQTLLEAGKPGPALTYLERFVSDESVKAPSKAVARAAIGLCYALKKDRMKADEVWATVDKSDPEAEAALAEAYLKAGLKDRNPVALANESLARLKKPGAAPSVRQVKSLLAVYAAAGSPEKALDIARRSDLKAFSYREVVNRTKIINFYDVALLGDLAKLYLQSSVAALEKSAEDAKLKGTADFYLGEAYALAGNVEKSLKVNAAFLATAGMPPQYRNKAAARQAANQYQKGHQFDAIGTWDELSKKQPGDPDLLAEILLSCARLGVNCPRIAQRSAAAAEAGNGKRYANLNVAVGRYYQSKREYARAVSYLETGRDKGNKNKIESNDPVMLVSLADAYYRIKKFSEALEIYFEMSRQFPEVRQIQEALQGIYAMEHKSAGDVKIN